MSRIPTEDLPGATAPVLSAALLTRIHELNFDYLELLIAEHQAGERDGQLQYLPVKLHSAIAALSPTARTLLARLPYTLYSLGFEDERFWRSSDAPSAALTVDERYARSHGMPLQAALCEVALLCAWHIASSNTLASRLIYAMHESTALRLAAAPLWSVKRLAAEHLSLLMPRWPTNPGFWPDLVRFAAAEDVERLATAKLLGSQLIAAELEASPLQSPRLRVRKLPFEVRPR